MTTKHAPELHSDLGRVPPGNLLVPESLNNLVTLGGVLLAPGPNSLNILLGEVEGDGLVGDLPAHTLAQSCELLLALSGVIAGTSEGALDLGLALDGDVGGLAVVEFVEEAGVEVRHDWSEEKKERQKRKKEGVGWCNQTSRTTKKTKETKNVWDIIWTFFIDIFGMGGVRTGFFLLNLWG